MPTGIYIRDYNKIYTPERNKKISNSLLGKKLSKEHRENLRKSHIGQISWNYIKDRSLLKRQNRRGDMAYVEWRKQVWKRDNWACQICGKRGGKVEAHHILGWSEFPEVRYEINNGITLCRAHHPRKRAEEKQMIIIFKETVNKLNK